MYVRHIEKGKKRGERKNDRREREQDFKISV
jgi:hypothetical protein